MDQTGKTQKETEMSETMQTLEREANLVEETVEKIMPKTVMTQPGMDQGEARAETDIRPLELIGQEVGEQDIKAESMY